MQKAIWKVDELNEVEVKVGFLGKNRILLNGTEVAGARVRKKTVIPFTLNNGRSAEMTVIPVTGLNPDRELRVEGQVVLSEEQRKQVSCLKCGKVAKPGDKFCDKCGAEIPTADTQLKIIKLRSARKAIAYTAGSFFVFGLILFAANYGAASDSLDKLSNYKATDIYPKLIDGEQKTVGELRQELQWESWGILVTNFILGAVMLGLYFYSKSSPLVALLIAMGVFMSVQVVNTILDPKTLGQGILVKILIIGFLVNGIRSALELRKVQS